MADARAFLDNAKGLARNPLGIVALFIALIYGFATLLLGSAADKLSSSERTPLVWFVVLFPVLVLFVFYRLVTKHHGKLYAPADYKQDESFLKTLPPELQRLRLEEEIETAEASTERPTISTTPATSTSAFQEPSRIPHRDREGFRAQYLLAESLAIKKLEKEYGIPFQSQVTFGEGRDTAFDAVAKQDDLFTAVEVKFLRHPFLSPLLLQEVLYRGVKASALLTKKTEDKRFRLILILVVGLTTEEEHEKLFRQATRLIQDAPISIELRVFKLPELQAEFET